MTRASPSTRRDFLFAGIGATFSGWPPWHRPKEIDLAEARFRIVYNGRSARRYLWIHGDEQTAREVLEKHIASHKGVAFFIESQTRDVPLAKRKDRPQSHVLALRRRGQPEIAQPRLDGRRKSTRPWMSWTAAARSCSMRFFRPTAVCWWPCTITPAIRCSAKSRSPSRCRFASPTIRTPFSCAPTRPISMPWPSPPTTSFWSSTCALPTRLALAPRRRPWRALRQPRSAFGRCRPPAANARLAGSASGVGSGRQSAFSRRPRRSG